MCVCDQEIQRALPVITMMGSQQLLNLCTRCTVQDIYIYIYLYKIQRSTVFHFSSFSDISGLTSSYSIWLKFTQETVEAINADIMHSCGYATGSVRGLEFYASPNRREGYHVHIRAAAEYEWLLDNFGKGVLALKWTNFIITHHRDLGACAYINGKLDTCTQIKHKRTLISSTSASCFSVAYGNSSLKENKIFLDDFAVWNQVLKTQQVEEIYTLGAKQIQYISPY